MALPENTSKGPQVGKTKVGQRAGAVSRESRTVCGLCDTEDMNADHSHDTCPQAVMYATSATTRWGTLRPLAGKNSVAGHLGLVSMGYWPMSRAGLDGDCCMLCA